MPCFADTEPHMVTGMPVLHTDLTSVVISFDHTLTSISVVEACKSKYLCFGAKSGRLISLQKQSVTTQAYQTQSKM
jgi:hypothetical protein